MDRERWIKAGLEIGEHLKEIRRIVNQSGIDHLSMFLHQGGPAEVLHIDDDEKLWKVTVDSDGAIGLEEDGFRFYTKI